MSEPTEAFLYHRYPKNMAGNTLMPLNAMRNVYPEVYERESAKYKGREELMKRRIQPLDCLWNDVIMFTFIEPKVMVEEYRAAGLKHAEVLKKWLKIPVSALDPTRLVVYHYDYSVPHEQLIPEEQLLPFSTDLLPKLTEFRQETKDYYRSIDRPLLFFRLAHALYRGSIPLSEFSVVEVE